MYSLQRGVCGKSSEGSINPWAAWSCAHTNMSPSILDPDASSCRAPVTMCGCRWSCVLDPNASASHVEMWICVCRLRGWHQVPQLRTMLVEQQALFQSVFAGLKCGAPDALRDLPALGAPRLRGASPPQYR